MHPGLLIRLFSLLGLLALMAPVSVNAKSLDAPSARPLAQANLINNPGFEGGFYIQAGDSSLQVGNGWAVWWEDTGEKRANLDYVLRPTVFNMEINPAIVRSGSAAQHIGKAYDPFHAGVVQTLDAPAGAQVRLSAWGYSYSSNEYYPAADSNKDARMQIGIDPNGKGIWHDAGVIWSGTMNPHLVWQQISLEATVGSTGRISVYLGSNYRGGSSRTLDSWWDDVSLIVLSAATGVPGTSVPPTNPPAPAITPFVMPTALPDGRIVYTVKAGDSLWHIAAIAGLTVEQLKAMNNLTSSVVSVGQQLVIGQVTPAVPPTPVPTATPEGVLPSPTPVPVVVTATGSVCVLLYDDVNGNGLRDSGEGLVPGGQFTVTNAGGTPVDGYLTTGAETEPRCFEHLAAGPYTVSVGIPAGFNPTTSTSFPLPLEADSIVNLEFGAQVSAAAGGSSSGDLSDSARLRTALIGAAGVVLLLLAAGVGGFIVLSRRR